MLGGTRHEAGVGQTVPDERDQLPAPPSLTHLPLEASLPRNETFLSGTDLQRGKYGHGSDLSPACMTGGIRPFRKHEGESKEAEELCDQASETQEW